MLKFVLPFFAAVAFAAFAADSYAAPKCKKGYHWCFANGKCVPG